MKNNLEDRAQKYKRASIQILVCISTLFLFNLILLNICYASTEHSSLATNNAKIIGCYSDQGTDIDKDDMYDFLTIVVGINVTVPGEYSLTGDLCDLRNRRFAWSEYHKNLSVGYQNMYLDFSGIYIEKHSTDGPYRIKNLTLLFGSSDAGISVCDEVFKTYNTHKYNYSDFDAPALANPVDQNMGLSGEGFGEVLLKASIRA